MNNLILIVVSFICGYVVAKIKKIKRSTIREKHLSPKYYGYEGGYSIINKCSDCDLVGLYEDLHEANCCPECGGRVMRFGSGIWQNIEGVKQWVKREKL